MQSDGNLVLRTSAGHVLWASQTAGTGTQNHIILTGAGNLVMYTSAHTEVWSSRTTAIVLPSGRSLFSGQLLDDRRGEQIPGHAESTLTMRPDGNLVYQCAGRVLWQSHTLYAGAYVSMLTEGRLAIFTPGASRRTLWVSNARRPDAFSYLDSADMKILSPEGTVVWAAPLLADSACS
jgi:hypothetical protein